jgi:hypothetical protein
MNRLSKVAEANTIGLNDFRKRAQLAAAAAAASADAVDVEARFPDEAFATARAQRLLGSAERARRGGPVFQT